MANKDFSLKVELKAEIDKFKKNMDRATAQNKKFSRQTQDIGKSLTKNIGKVVGVIMAAKGAMVAFDKSIHATQATGDLFDKKMEGMRGSVDRFFEKVSSGDLSNLIADLQAARTAAENFQLAIDEIGDVRRALSVQKAQNLLKIEELKLEVEKYKVSNPEKARKAAQEIVRISQEEIQKSMAVSDYQLKSIRNKLLETYGISLRDWDLLMDYISNYDKLTQSIYGSDLLSDTDFEKAQKLQQVFKDLEKAKKNKITMAAVATGAYDMDDFKRSQAEINRLQGEYNELVSQAPKAVRQWITVLPLVNNLTDEERQSIADLLIQRANEQRELVRREKQGEVYLRQLSDEKTTTDQLTDSVKKLTQAKNVNAEALKNRDQYSPGGGTGDSIGGHTPYIANGDQRGAFLDTKEKLQYFQEEMAYMTEGFVTDTIYNIGDSIGEAIVTGGWDSAFNSVLESFGGFLQRMGGLLIAWGIAKTALAESLKKLVDPVSAGVVIAAGAALVAVGSTMKATMSSFAGGSSYGGGGTYASGGSNVSNGEQTVRFVIEGDKLVGAIDNHNRKSINIG